MREAPLRESHESAATSSFPAPSPPPHPSSPLPPVAHSDPKPHDTLLAQAPGDLAAKKAAGRFCAPPPLAAERAKTQAQAAAAGSGHKGEPLERRPPRPEEDGKWCHYCNLPKPLRTHQRVLPSAKVAPSLDAGR